MLGTLGTYVGTNVAGEEVPRSRESRWKKTGFSGWAVELKFQGQPGQGQGDASEGFRLSTAQRRDRCRSPLYYIPVKTGWAACSLAGATTSGMEGLSSRGLPSL